MEWDWFGFVGPHYNDYYMSEAEAEANGITEKATRNAFNALAASAASLTVNLNSEGGYTDTGVAIMNLVRLESDNRRKTNPDFKSICRVVGVAYSAASIICQGFDEIQMMAGTEMMIHRASSYQYGTEEDMRKMAEHLQGVDERISNIFAPRMSKSVADVLSLLKNETFLSPEKALEAGLITSVNSSPARFSPPVRGESFNYGKWLMSRPQLKPVNVSSVADGSSAKLLSLRMSLHDPNHCTP